MDTLQSLQKNSHYQEQYFKNNQRIMKRLRRSRFGYVQLIGCALLIAVFWSTPFQVLSQLHIGQCIALFLGVALLIWR